ncbi:helix-turn-helix domain-containing protein [Streptomyces sp. NPDC006208]|uniref:helix-turn-helix domain-containing protein n=1 Tax=Streptomyces sp. NPDC006208 TaxID=3156734 RepID=UPI0033BCC172
MPDAGVPMEPSRRTITLTDPRALRAYAHPTRMRLVGLLRHQGPFTATTAAELTGESVASCSYHLRMLAKYGLVEEAGGGQGREKPWRATATYTEWPDHSDDPAVTEAATALGTAVAERYFERMTKAIESRHLLSEQWQEAESFGDTMLYLTPEELVRVRHEMNAVLAPYEDRNNDASLRPEESRPVEFLRIAFVRRESTERS